MKVIYLSSSAVVVYLMRVTFRRTYDAKLDVFRVRFLIGPALFGALIFTHEYNVTDIAWTFSIILESVAILPQLMLLQRTGSVENLTAQFVAALGGYRVCYLLNWIYRLVLQGRGYRQWLVWTCGLIQTALYGDFFYHYFKAQAKGERLVLPS